MVNPPGPTNPVEPTTPATLKTFTGPKTLTDLFLAQFSPGAYLAIAGAGTTGLQCPEGYYCVITHLTFIDHACAYLQVQITPCGDGTVPIDLEDVGDTNAVPAGKIALSLNRPVVLDEGETITAVSAAGTYSGGIRYVLVPKIRG